MRQPRIFTASFFAPDDHKPGTVFSIANRQPRGFGLPKVDVFRPRTALRNFRIHQDWARYRREYIGLLSNRDWEIYRWLEAQEGDVTFCCWEADPGECHRKWAAEYLRSALGCEVMVR